MKYYKVDYTFYDGDNWTHTSGSQIVEAKDEMEARALVERHVPWGDYCVDHVEEMK